jgi:regulator of protease activity HflC (stomatin/prohibitin superfamily)
MPRNDDNESGMPTEIKMGIYGVIAVIFLIILLIFIFGSWYTIGAGERGIVLTFSKPSVTISEPGLHFKIPIVQRVIRMDVRTQTVAFDNKAATGGDSEYDSLAALSSDLQDVAVATVVNYHLEEKDVLQIYQQYGDMNTYQKNILEPVVRDSVKTVAATYTAEDLSKKRGEFNQKIADLLQVRFTEKSALFERVNIVNFEYSTLFATAIEQKATAEQNALTEKNNLAKVEYQAQQRIAQADGEAKAIQIQVQAINQQGGANYIELKRIEKWSGNYPYVMGGNSIVDMRDMVGSSSAYVTSSSTSNHS